MCSSGGIRAGGNSSPEFPGPSEVLQPAGVFMDAQTGCSLQVSAVFSRKISAGILQGIHFVSAFFIQFCVVLVESQS